MINEGPQPSSTEAPVVINVAAALGQHAERGEQRPIHRRRYRRVKPVPKRPSMLDPHRTEIDGWLDAEPAMTAVDVLSRLKALHPDRFTDDQLRTTQRMVKAWRGDQAKRVIRCGTAALSALIAEDTAAPTPPPWVHRDLPRAAAPES